MRTSNLCKRVMMIAAVVMTMVASTLTSAEVINFSNLTTADYSIVPQTYQPVTGVTITWASAYAWGTNTWSGGRDHTKSVDSAAPSKEVGSAYIFGPHNFGDTVSFTMTFDQAVEIPSLWVTGANGGNTVTVKGFTSPSDVTPAAQTTTSAFWPNGNDVTATWREITALGNTPIRSLQVIATYTASWDANAVGVYVDDITINPVPEPASLMLVGLAGLGLLPRGSRRGADR